MFEEHESLVTVSFIAQDFIMITFISGFGKVSMYRFYFLLSISRSIFLVYIDKCMHWISESFRLRIDFGGVYRIHFSLLWASCMYKPYTCNWPTSTVPQSAFRGKLEHKKTPHALIMGPDVLHTRISICAWAFLPKLMHA